MMPDQPPLTPMPDDVKGQLQKVILPVVTSSTSGAFYPVGSCFIISVFGRYALAASAAHIFSEIVRQDRRYELNHPTTPPQFRPSPSSDIQLKRTYQHALLRDNDGTYHVATIPHVYINNPSDIAVCVVRLDDHVPASVLFDSKLAIDTTPPKEGLGIIVSGYSQMGAEYHVNSEMTLATARYQQKLEWRRGFITAAYAPHGPRGQPFPCFQCDVPFDGGMSGGPIVEAVPTTSGELLVVRGIVCSDSAIDAGDMGAGSGLDAIGSTLWPMMAISVAETTPGGQTRQVRLLELQQSGIIDDRGNASEHIKMVPGSTPTNFEMRWV